ncbi:MAG: CAP domain-containing protein [Gaiellaceae bacterium]
MAARRALILGLATLMVASGVCAAGADAAPSASLLAPAGVCGPAADRLNLDATIAERAMLCLTNYARRHAGRKPLALSLVLDRAGQAKLAADLSCGDFSHSPCGEPFQSVFGSYVAGASWYTIGENIAWGTGQYGTPRETMNSWLNSPEHLQNILNSAFHDLGIGYLPGQSFQGATGATLWSQEFGGRSRAPSR